MNDLTPTPGDGAATPETDDARVYRVRVGEFEGPLDLLLHLVRVNEVEITDIPIVEITAQYNEYLELMQQLNLEIAGEYLVMAATLMHIKSQMLLPPVPGNEDSEAGDDPRAELAEQLLEYQRFKQAAENLQALESRRTLIWTRRTVPDEFEGEELLTLDMVELLQAFRKLCGRLDEEARLRVRRDTVSVAEKMEWLQATLDEGRSVDLLELLEGLATRLDRIATFLAVLELMRMGRLVAFQRKLFGDIRIARVVHEPESSGVSEGREADADDGAAPDARPS